LRSPGAHGHGPLTIILEMHSSAQTFELITFASRASAFFAHPPFQKREKANTGHPACQAFFSTFSSKLDGFVACVDPIKAGQNIS